MTQTMNKTNIKPAYSFQVRRSSSTKAIVNAQKQVSLARILHLEQQTHERLNQIRKVSHTNENKHIKV